MARFEDLQTLWQHQQPPVGRPDTASITMALAKYGRRQNWITIAKVFAILAVIGWLIAHSRGSVWALCGVAATAALALVLITVEWRNQRAISRLNFAEPSAGFVRNAIDRLMEQREPLRKYYWPSMLFLVGVINLMFLGLPRTESALRRFTSHVIGSALPFVAYELGRRVRIRRFEAECLPLVERLTALKRALEELSQ
jgi:hypothetical protein